MTFDDPIERLLTADRDAFRITWRTADVVTAKVRDADGVFDVSWYSGDDGVGHWTCTCQPLPNVAPPCVHIELIGRVTAVPVEAIG